MKTTLEKYNRLCDMNLITRANYDINARIPLIFAEVQQLLDEYERQAREMFNYHGPLPSPRKILEVK